MISERITYTHEKPMAELANWKQLTWKIQKYDEN